MKIEVWVVGKNEKEWISAELSNFGNRISRYIPFSFHVVQIKKKFKKADHIKIFEGEEILSKLRSSDYIILLDERGKSYTSEKFANKLNSLTLLGNRRVIFIIGGAFGFSGAVYKRSNEMLSLSEMTFTHQLARVFLLEQIYRGFSILKNEPYHNQ